MQLIINFNSEIEQFFYMIKFLSITCVKKVRLFI